MTFDLPDPFGPISTFSGPNSIGAESGPNDNRFRSCSVRINLESPFIAFHSQSILFRMTPDILSQPLPPAPARQLPLLLCAVVYLQSHVNHSQGLIISQECRPLSEFPHFLTAPLSLFILTRTDEATAPSDSFRVASSFYFAPNSRPLFAPQLLNRGRLGGQTAFPKSRRPVPLVGPCCRRVPFEPEASTAVIFNPVGCGSTPITPSHSPVQGEHSQ